MRRRPKLYPMNFNRAVDGSAATEKRFERCGTGVWLAWRGMRDGSGCDFVDDIGEADAILLFQSIPFDFEWNMKFYDDPDLVWKSNSLTHRELAKYLTIQRSGLPVIYYFTDFTASLRDLFLYRPNRMDVYREWGIRRLDPDRVFVLHFGRDADRLVTEWNGCRNIPLPADNFFYADIDAVYWTGMAASARGLASERIVYCGNSRKGEKTEFLSRFENLDVYGRWTDKQKIGLPDARFRKQVPQKFVSGILHRYFGQLCTMNKKVVDCRATCNKLVQTVSSGVLPLVDERLGYLVPDKFKSLLVSNSDDVDRVRRTVPRVRTIFAYQKAMAEHFAKNNMSTQIPKIVRTILRRRKSP
jgi:hypothetical protein